MKFEKQFREAHPETVGEIDQDFDRHNYTEWLENQITNGSFLIIEERARQIEKEGWTPEHDDENTDLEMVNASACYLHASITASLRKDAARYHEQPPFAQGPAHWPWDREWWKPSDDPIKNLVKAGALIAAEIDRLKRKEGNGI